MEEFQLTNDNKINQYPCWHPDGSHILFVSQPQDEPDDDLRIISAQGGSSQLYMDFTLLHIFYPSFSLDGSKIVFYFYSDKRRKAEIASYSYENKTRILYSGSYNLKYPHWLSSDELLCIYQEDLSSQLAITDISTKQTTIISQKKEGQWDYHPQWFPDNNKIVFYRFHNGIWITSVENKVENQINSFGAMAALSPNGNKILCESTEEFNREIVLQDLTTNQITKFANMNYKMPIWAPDGKKFACTSYNSLYIFKIDSTTATLEKRFSGYLILEPDLEDLLAMQSSPLIPDEPSTTLDRSRETPPSEY